MTGNLAAKSALKCSRDASRWLPLGARGGSSWGATRCHGPAKSERDKHGSCEPDCADWKWFADPRHNRPWNSPKMSSVLDGSIRHFGGGAWRQAVVLSSSLRGCLTSTCAPEPCVCRCRLRPSDGTIGRVFPGLIPCCLDVCGQECVHRPPS